jgi:fructose-bisphosphate aldolase, class II
MVRAMVESLKIDVPVCLHLDHGTFEQAIECMNAGFSSVMFDGSHYPIDENIQKTKEIVALAHARGISVEAEVGAIGGEEDGIIGSGEVADPNECKMIADLGVDLLAAGIGNIHGSYPKDWPGLRLDVLKQVQDLTGQMPLVLHGGTGIPDKMVQEAITLGVSKINVNTELQLTFAATLRQYFAEGKDQIGKGFDPRKIITPGMAAIKAAVKEKMTLFGSVNQA